MLTELVVREQVADWSEIVLRIAFSSSLLFYCYKGKSKTVHLLELLYIRDYLDLS